MSKTQQAVHVARTKSRRVNKAGETVEYESVLLLTAALSDDGAATGFDDGVLMETPRQEVPGGALVVMVAA